MSYFLSPVLKSLSPFIASDKRSYSFHEFFQKVAGISFLLKKKGITRNSMVAFPGKLSTETIAFLFALLELEAIACPLNSYIHEEKRKKLIENLAEPYYFNAEEIDFLYRKAKPKASHPYWNEHKTSFLLFTSGSSSPKIVALSLSNFLFSAKGTIEAFNINQGDGWLLALPLFHVGGISILFRSLLSQSRVIISEKLLETHIFNKEISILSLVPTQLFRLIDKNDPAVFLALKEKKSLLIGGAAIPYLLWQHIQELELPVFTTYGMTEMSSQITMSQKKEQTYHAGKPLPYRTLKLALDKEILVKGETLFQGYYTKEKGVIPVALLDGYFPTKDLGYFDNHGCLHVIGRKDLMFVSGGENIHPEEIEKALMELGFIKNAMVVAVDDKEWGKVPFAFVELDEKTSPSLKDIPKKLEEKLSSIKIPKGVLPLPKLENSLKISRALLTDLAHAFRQDSAQKSF